MTAIRCYALMGLTGDLLKTELQTSTQYCSKDAGQFMIPLMLEYWTKYLSMPLYLRGDIGFASLEFYEACEEYETSMQSALS